MLNPSHYRPLIIALACLALGLLLFSEEKIKDTQKSASEAGTDRPAAFVEGARFTLYDDKGFSTNLQSKSALFYAQSDQIDIEHIEATLSNEQGEIIQLSANNGEIQPDSDTLMLSGNVIIEQIVPSDKTWSIESDQISIDRKQAFISSNQAVTIRKDQSVIQATGLNGWLNEKRIELLSNVRGQYAFNK